MLSLALLLSAQTVSVQPETKHFVRPEEMGAPREGTIRRPILSGIPEPALSKAQKAVSFERVFDPGVPLEQSGAVGYDYDEDFFVGRGVLSITLKLELMGAYPTTESRQVNVDLKTGRTLLPSTIFQKTSALVAALEKARRESVAKAITAANAEDKETIQRQLHGRFTAKNLSEFRVDEKGVTFVYDFDFIHAVKALEPEGRFLLPWSKLRPYVRKSSPLARYL